MNPTHLLLAPLLLLGATDSQHLLLLFDAPSGTVAEPPVVTVVGEQTGEHTTTLRDDGEGMDAIEGDHRYSGRIKDVVPDRLRVTLTTDDTTLTDDIQVSTGIAGLRELTMAIVDDRLALQLDIPKPIVVEVTPPLRNPMEPGLLLWGFLVSVVNILAAFVLIRRGTRLVRPARLSRPKPTQIAPVGIELEHVNRALEGPLAGYRVVLVGQVRPLPDKAFPCDERGVSPGELVAAVQELALTPGPPVAVLVVEPGDLDPAGLVPALVAVDRCLKRLAPLWAVRAPKSWKRWAPPAS